MNVESQALDAFFGSHPELTEVPEAPAPVEPAPEAPAEPAKPEAPKVSLAEEIRRGREERAAREARDKDVASWKERAEAAEARLAKRSKLDVLADTEAWIEEHELTPEEQSVLGQRLLYSLVPDKAPENFRYEMMEARAARRERLAEERRAKEASEAEVSRARQIEQSYVSALVAVAEAPETAGTAPHSAAWFAEEGPDGSVSIDADAWAQSLLNTAKNMAEAARAAGQKPDLNPAKVAAVLEADIAKRFARVPGKAAPTPPEPKAPPAVATKQVAVTTSTKGLTAAPAPRSKPRTEAEALESAKALLAKL